MLPTLSVLLCGASQNKLEFSVQKIHLLLNYSDQGSVQMGQELLHSKSVLQPSQTSMQSNLFKNPTSILNSEYFSATATIQKTLPEHHCSNFCSNRHQRHSLLIVTFLGNIYFLNLCIVVQLELSSVDQSLLL